MYLYIRTWHLPLLQLLCKKKKKSTKATDWNTRCTWHSASQAAWQHTSAACSTFLRRICWLSSAKKKRCMQLLRRATSAACTHSTFTFTLTTLVRQQKIVFAWPRCYAYPCLPARPNASSGVPGTNRWKRAVVHNSAHSSLAKTGWQIDSAHKPFSTASFSRLFPGRSGIGLYFTSHL